MSAFEEKKIIGFSEFKNVLLESASILGSMSETEKFCEEIHPILKEYVSAEKVRALIGRLEEERRRATLSEEKGIINKKIELLEETIK